MVLAFGSWGLASLRARREDRLRRPSFFLGRVTPDLAHAGKVKPALGCSLQAQQSPLQPVALLLSSPVLR